MRKSVHPLGLALVLFVVANTGKALPLEPAAASPGRSANENTIAVYPAPEGIQASNLYTVQVTPGNSSADIRVRNTSAQSSFVYEVENQWSGISTELTNSWTSFDFTGSVTVQVQLTLPSSQQPFAVPAALVLPSHAHVKAAIETSAPGVYLATFTIHQPGQFAVDFYDQASDP